MTAIALAESGGNTDAHALTSREDSRGLWQINARAHPEFAGQNLYDARTNARAAKVVYDKQGLGAWSVFTTKDPQRSYTRYLQSALGASGGGTSIADILRAIPTAAGTLAGVAGDVASKANPLSGLEGVAQALGGAAGLAAKAGTWISDPRNWVRIIYVQAGVMLLVGALVILVAPTVIGLASPTGKAGKAVKAVRSVSK